MSKPHQHVPPHPSSVEDQQLSQDGIDRRGFLKCMAWAGTGLVWSFAAGVPVSHVFGQSHPAQKQSDFSFVQISDSHIGFNKPTNTDVTATLNAALDKIDAVAQTPDFLIHTGDLTHSSQAAEFETFSQVADLHVNALASTNPVDVVSSDRHTVKPWFQGKIPFSFNVPEFAGTDFALLGGKLIYLQQQPGAQLIVAMKQHRISVLIFQDSPALSNALRLNSQVKSRNAFNVETWHSQSLRFFVIGDTDPAEIDKLAQSLKQANK